MNLLHHHRCFEIATWPLVVAEVVVELNWFVQIHSLLEPVQGYHLMVEVVVLAVHWSSFGVPMAEKEGLEQKLDLTIVLRPQEHYSGELMVTLVVVILMLRIFFFLGSSQHLHGSLCDSPYLHRIAAVVALVVVAVGVVVAAAKEYVAVVVLEGCIERLVDELYY